MKMHLTKSALNNIFRRLSQTRGLRFAGIAAIVFCLSACKSELYSQLEERDANEMIAVLMQHGITSHKEIQRDGSNNLLVEKSLIAQALTVLKDNGLPRTRFDNMGELFEKDGLISSPIEERVRFIYALQQNLQETLSQIDGVMVARVHVVLPENNPFAENAKPSSASVFIKHKPAYRLDDIRSEIKMIVGNSIESLSYRDVSVTLVAAAKNNASNPESPLLTQSKLHSVGMPGFLWIILGLGGLLVTGSALFKTRKPADAASSTEP